MSDRLGATLPPRDIGVASRSPIRGTDLRVAAPDPPLKLDPELAALLVEAHNVLGNDVLNAAAATALDAIPGVTTAAILQEHTTELHEMDAASFARVQAAHDTRFGLAENRSAPTTHKEGRGVMRGLVRG